MVIPCPLNMQHGPSCWFGSDERNYHIFYQLVCGANEKERKEFHLLPAEKFRYLASGGSVSVPGMNDNEEFQIGAASSGK